ncbi:MAG: hypothetical protein H6Q52_307 [Deltaproteobacteria bacterium]|nr:hypothetical protein [Deltaproteobacteria bacterium]
MKRLPCVVDIELADHWLTYPCRNLHGLYGLNEANLSRDDPQDAGVTSGRHEMFRRWFGKHAAQAWSARLRVKDA